MNKLMNLLFFLVCQISVIGQTINYTGSASIIANPERGLQKYSITASDYATNIGASNLSVATLRNWKNGPDKVTVVYRHFLMDAFMGADINSTFLNNIQGDLNNIRTAGLKVIVRFSYSKSIDDSPQQPSKALILKHISQLSSLINENKDIIFSLQAGFIGTWGEWYYTNSTEFGTEGAISKEQWANRKEVLDALLAAAPFDIPVQVRYPGIKRTLYGTGQLSPQTAYKNTPNARIGFFNDAFLNNYGDMGTYSVNAKCKNPVGTTEYNYLANETQYLPMTGETNGLNECDEGLRTKGENAVVEMELTNWTSLNRDYYTPFWNQIIESNHYDEILKKLGYRFVLNSSTLTSNGSDFDLTLTITNLGFARPFKQRNVYLVMKNTKTNDTTALLIDTDIRTWDDSVSITQNFDVGLTGTFQLYLWLPDIETSLASNPDYSIQFANSGLWESAFGYNNLLQTVELYSLGVNDQSDDNLLSVYKNPSSDYITIQFNNSEKENIQIYDVKGKLVKEKTILNHQKMDISELLNGIYFIRVDNNNLLTQKFIKQ